MPPLKMLYSNLFLACLAISSSGAQASVPLTPTQKLTIEQITSIFENGTPDFQYGYIEDIGDGAGITCGRVGFTNTEIELIVGRYVQKNPASPLAQYLPCLQKMGEGIMKDYSCLYPSVSADDLASQDFKTEGGTIGQVDFGKAWTDAANDPVMQKVQDDYEDQQYFEPSLALSNSVGLSTPLGAAFVYDSCIQMDCEHLLKTLSQQFASSHGGRTAPANQDEEAQWLSLYIPERKKELSVTPAGAATVDRVDSLAQILDTQNFQLNLPLEFDYSGNHFSLPGNQSLFWKLFHGWHHDNRLHRPAAANRSTVLRVKS